MQIWEVLRRLHGTMGYICSPAGKIWVVDDVLEIQLQAVPRFDGDIRLPDYLMEGRLLRDGAEEHRFFHRHLGSYE